MDLQVVEAAMDPRINYYHEETDFVLNFSFVEDYLVLSNV